ncbi:aldo/keto reductase [Halobellus clavatus]|uniref:2,5-diketo-D-gluconate reductase B n=1 Tax=Halobellus clavatus TaxID=660517 RepID=A0A1H3FB89_9EURY|nr:2,5-diketo-D-gluconate reductase B [Halobellus clavatus]
MNAHEQRRVELTDGMPILGLGTWQNDDATTCANTVQTALEAGYRHVDTAQAYGNEQAVGQGLAAADVDREDVFLATKVWIDNLGYDDVLESTQASLKKLGVDYLDLLYIHWPSRAYDPVETFRAFDELVDRGAIRRIGISNFLPEHVEEAIEHADAPIFANQVELHPLLPQADLREYCAERDVEVVAYSPLARGEVFDVPEIVEIADKHDVSAAQVSLAWLREKGLTAIPKATGESHLLDNLASVDLELDAADVEAIDAIDRTDRTVDPGFSPW